MDAACDASDPNNRGVSFGGKGSTQHVVKGSKKDFPQELFQELKIICQDNISLDYDERYIHGKPQNSFHKAVNIPDVIVYPRSEEEVSKIVKLCNSHKSHEEAKRFRFKVILNWDDIVDLCAKDRANGIGAESALDADDAISKEAHEEEEVSNPNMIDLEEPSPATTKKGQFNRAIKGKDKEGLVHSMKEVAESFKEFVQVTKKRMEGNTQEVVQEVMKELKMVVDLDNTMRFKAIAWLTENPNK